MKLRLHARMHLATSEKDQPRLCPVTLINLQKRLHAFVHSFKETAKVRQIKMNPKTEFCLFLGEPAPPSKRYVRARCKAQVVADKDVKAKIHNEIGFVKQYHQSPDDPSYILIELQPLAWQLTQMRVYYSVQILFTISSRKYVL